MAKKGYTPEQIINILREAEILLSQGNTVSVITKKIGISDYTYYRWRRGYTEAAKENVSTVASSVEH